MPVHNFFEKKPKIDPSVFIAPSATVIGDVVIGTNSSVWPNAVIRGDSNRVRIGAFTNIQDNVVIDAKQSGSVVLGNNVSIGHGAILHGCHVGHNIIIGMGAIIMENVSIKDWVIVGAGSIVTQNITIPSNSVVMGIPAHIIRTLNAQQRKSITQNAEEYQALAQQYRRLKPCMKL
jgi:carbonic anhydrase/acetyltransferase-like protein (isoleucine patch superfamily)